MQTAGCIIIVFCMIFMLALCSCPFLKKDVQKANMEDDYHDE